jgi:cAMP-dependent protein kinase regulator
MNLADALIPKTYASGDVIVRQGDPADGMFFVEAGMVDVFVASGSGTRKKVQARQALCCQSISNNLYLGQQH